MALILAFTACRGGEPKKPNNGKPALEFSAAQSVIPAGESGDGGHRNHRGHSADSVDLSWSSINSTHCRAYGDWTGSKDLNGSERVAVAGSKSRFILSCYGETGATSRTLSVTAAKAGTPGAKDFPAESAAGCRDEGNRQGDKGVAGTETTLVPQRLSGLVFPSNGETQEDIRFAFTEGNLPPMYPASYLWRVNPRRQAGYYTTFFWGPNGDFTGASYYGCHPYPDGKTKPSSRTHKWELSIDREDFVSDFNGHSTQVEYDVWKTQALRVYAEGGRLILEFYWDMPDTAKVIRQSLPGNYGTPEPEDPALTFGDAPWAIGAERLSGILRGIQIYSQALPLRDLSAEAESPLSTSLGTAHIWYLNINPTPDDICDKSGRGHHPAWAGPARAGLWTGP